MKYIGKKEKKWHTFGMCIQFIPVGFFFLIIYFVVIYFLLLFFFITDCIKNTKHYTTSPILVGIFIWIGMIFIIFFQKQLPTYLMDRTCYLYCNDCEVMYYVDLLFNFGHILKSYWNITYMMNTVGTLRKNV